MCAILDTNAAHQVFGLNCPPEGEQFYDWITSGRGRLVVGGRLLQELDGNGDFQEWMKEATLAGWVKIFNEETINGRIRQLERRGLCRSDDVHVVAFAQISNARLLYSKDKNLQRDFKDKQLLDNPRGKVYSAPGHERLLGMRGLCHRGR